MAFVELRSHGLGNISWKCDTACQISLNLYFLCHLPIGSWLLFSFQTEYLPVESHNMCFIVVNPGGQQPRLMTIRAGGPIVAVAKIIPIRKPCIFVKVILNSLCPINVIWWHRHGSTLAQVMARCLMPPSPYLNQCWFIISRVLWHSTNPNPNFRGSAQNNHSHHGFKIYM